MNKKTPLTEEWMAAACHGKHRYESAELARQIARRQRRREESCAMAYRCPTCHGWHIGNSNKSYARRNRT